MSVKGEERTFEKKDSYMPSSEIQGDDQSGCVSVETSSDGLSAGRVPAKVQFEVARKTVTDITAQDRAS
jgi:hypothetical protein